MSITKVSTHVSLIQTVTEMSITKVSIEGYSISEEEVEKLVRDSDIDGDGNVNYQGKHLCESDTDGDGNVNYQSKH